MTIQTKYNPGDLVVWWDKEITTGQIISIHIYTDSPSRSTILYNVRKIGSILPSYDEKEYPIQTFPETRLYNSTEELIKDYTI